LVPDPRRFAPDRSLELGREILVRGRQAVTLELPPVALDRRANPWRPRRPGGGFVTIRRIGPGHRFDTARGVTALGRPPTRRARECARICWGVAGTDRTVFTRVVDQRTRDHSHWHEKQRCAADRDRRLRPSRPRVGWEPGCGGVSRSMRGRRVACGRFHSTLEHHSARATEPSLTGRTATVRADAGASGGSTGTGRLVTRIVRPRGKIALVIKLEECGAGVRKPAIDIDVDGMHQLRRGKGSPNFSRTRERMALTPIVEPSLRPIQVCADEKTFLVTQPADEPHRLLPGRSTLVDSKDGNFDAEHAKVVRDAFKRRLLASPSGRGTDPLRRALFARRRCACSQPARRPQMASICACSLHRSPGSERRLLSYRRS
jgi:hypothetical protein